MHKKNPIFSVFTKNQFFVLIYRGGGAHKQTCPQQIIFFYLSFFFLRIQILFEEKKCSGIIKSCLKRLKLSAHVIICNCKMVIQMISYKRCVHSFNGDYLSIPSIYLSLECTYSFHEYR